MKDAFELLTAFQDMHRKDKAKSLSHYDKARQVVGSLRQQLTAMDVQLLDLRQQVIMHVYTMVFAMRLYAKNSCNFKRTNGSAKLFLIVLPVFSGI